MKMKKAWIAVAAVALLALPVAAGAHRKDANVVNAAKYCKSLRAQMGVEAFREAYGGQPNAFGKCVKKRAHELRDARKTARKACAEELGVKRFRHDGEKSKAFRKCVRAKIKADTSGDDEQVVNAAKLCAAEREQNETAFAEKYGSNHNKRNAFGKCVSQHSQDDEPEAGEEKPAAPTGS
jgi:hypothetical protein